MYQNDLLYRFPFTVPHRPAVVLCPDVLVCYPDQRLFFLQMYWYAAQEPTWRAGNVWSRAANLSVYMCE